MPKSYERKLREAEEKRRPQAKDGWGLWLQSLTLGLQMGCSKNWGPLFVDVGAIGDLVYIRALIFGSSQTAKTRLVY